MNHFSTILLFSFALSFAYGCEDTNPPDEEDASDQTADFTPDDTGDSEVDQLSDDAACTPRVVCEPGVCGNQDDGCGGSIECDAECLCEDGRPKDSETCGPCGLGAVLCDGGENGEDVCSLESIPGLIENPTAEECAQQLIFVDANAVDGGDGSQTSPYSTYAAAAGVDLTAIDVDSGGYSGPNEGKTFILSDATLKERIVVFDGAHILGGFKRIGSVWFATNQKTLIEQEPLNSEYFSVLHAAGISSKTIIKQLHVQGAANNVARTVEGDSGAGVSIGALISQSDGVEFHDVIVESGKGTDGEDGLDGADGFDGIVGLNAVPGNLGSGPGTIVGQRPPAADWNFHPKCSSVGGQGGLGGGLSIAPGAGELGGRFESILFDTRPTGDRGSHGAKGLARIGPNSISQGHGTAGQRGEDGQGGQGGRGAEHFDYMIGMNPFWSWGASGASGGTGGCGGEGGKPGAGGAASYGLALVQSNLKIQNSTIISGSGGKGGTGGRGGKGGVGALGGRGANQTSVYVGLGSTQSVNGDYSSAGGQGYNGGDGGAGGSGAGGLSIAIFCLASSPQVTNSALLFAPAASGGGGEVPGGKGYSLKSYNCGL